MVPLVVVERLLTEVLFGVVLVRFDQGNVAGGTELHIGAGSLLIVGQAIGGLTSRGRDLLAVGIGALGHIALVTLPTRLGLLGLHRLVGLGRLIWCLPGSCALGLLLGALFDELFEHGCHKRRHFGRRVVVGAASRGRFLLSVRVGVGRVRVGFGCHIGTRGVAERILRSAPRAVVDQLIERRGGARAICDARVGFTHLVHQGDRLGDHRATADGSGERST